MILFFAGLRMNSDERNSRLNLAKFVAVSYNHVTKITLTSEGVFFLVWEAPSFLGTRLLEETQRKSLHVNLSTLALFPTKANPTNLLSATRLPRPNSLRCSIGRCCSWRLPWSLPRAASVHRSEANESHWWAGPKSLAGLFGSDRQAE